ncbi:hypothetical protein [Sphingobium baderi]|uniref:hypothetical protein n=1 Tax=Sphingobium baderi TaxID=1332080 RepID=UPI002B402785|nr:hypothetical protein [Sphingobium baderi]WRD77196.1 hypothetical protein QQ987_03390 [Sphingobium baderi]
MESSVSINPLEELQAKHRDELNEKQNQLQAHMAETLSTFFDSFIRRVEEDAKIAVERDIQIMPLSVR